MCAGFDVCGVTAPVNGAIPDKVCVTSVFGSVLGFGAAFFFGSAAFLAGAFLAGAFLAGAFFAGAAFLAGAFFFSVMEVIVFLFGYFFSAPLPNARSLGLR